MAKIAILSPGDMGSNIGKAKHAAGHKLLTCLAGRSEATRQRAEKTGFEVLPDFESVCTQADIILAILPPASALELARTVAAAMTRAQAFPVYADCNAVSPRTTQKIARVILDAGAPFVDGGIIGPPPSRGRTRLYISGPAAAALGPLNGDGVNVYTLGEDIGRASAMKMAYGALTKGRAALETAVLLAARRLGLYDELVEELRTSQPEPWKEIQASIPYLAAKAGRWTGEMEEIATTYADVGVTPLFHQGASDIFRVLAESPLGKETRETVNWDRTLPEALDLFEEALPPKPTTKEPTG